MCIRDRNVNSDKLGAVIRAERKRQGLTLDELSEKVGVTAAHLSYVENGKRGVSTEQLNKLGVTLQIPAAFLTVLGTDENATKRPAVTKLLKSTQKAILKLLELEHDRAATKR